MDDDGDAVLRPSAAYFLTYAGDGYTAADMDAAPAGSMRAKWLTWLYWRERTEQWLSDHTEPYAASGGELPRYHAMRAAFDAYQDEIATTLGQTGRERGQVIIAPQTALWWWSHYGLLEWQGALHERTDDDAVPEFVLGQVAYWFLTPPPYPEHDTGTGSKRQDRRPRAPSPRHSTILAYAPVQSFVEGMAMFAEKTGIVQANHRAPHVTTRKGNVVSVGGALETVLDQAQSAAAYTAALKLSNDTIAAFVMGLACWCKEADRGNPRSYVRIPLNDYCAARHWKKHQHGGYQQYHRQKALDQFLRLNQVWGHHKVPEDVAQGWIKNGIKKEESRYVQGQAMVVSAESSDKPGRRPTAVLVSPGHWADHFLQNNPGCVALVLERILTIDNSTRAGEFAYRLGIYTALNWRTKILKNNASQGHKVRELLRVLGIDPEAVTHREHRKRISDYLEDALDLLQQAEVLGTRDGAGDMVADWRYANASAGDRDASYSWDEWLNWTVLLPPPQVVIDFYPTVRQAQQAAIRQEGRRKARSDRAVIAAQAARQQQDPH